MFYTCRLGSDRTNKACFGLMWKRESKDIACGISSCLGLPHWNVRVLEDEAVGCRNSEMSIENCNKNKTKCVPLFCFEPGRRSSRFKFCICVDVVKYHPPRSLSRAALPNTCILPTLGEGQCGRGRKEKKNENRKKKRQERKASLLTAGAQRKGVRTKEGRVFFPSITQSYE